MYFLALFNLFFLIQLLKVFIPEIRWRNTLFLFKHIAEIENRLKAKFVTDFLDAFIGGNQQLFSAGNPQL